MSATIGKVYVDAVIADERYKECMALVHEANERIDELRELVLDMYGFIERMDEECGDVTFSDCFDYCRHDTADDGCCKTGECWYERRMRELGIEVDG